MISSVISEDFEVTPAIRAHVERNTDDLSHFMPDAQDDLTVTYFLRQEAERLFSATIRAHYWGREFVATHSASDLYVAINLAKKHLVRQLNHIRGRRSAMKRRFAPPKEISTSISE